MVYPHVSFHSHCPCSLLSPACHSLSPNHNTSQEAVVQTPASPHLKRAHGSSSRRLEKTHLIVSCGCSKTGNPLNYRSGTDLLITAFHQLSNSSFYQSFRHLGLGPSTVPGNILLSAFPPTMPCQDQISSTQQGPR